MAASALARARAGSENAFSELVAPYRRELHLHCYRMLGSLTDAEDLLQETLLAAWKALADFEERSSLRSWLYRIATRRCLNALRDARRRIQAEPVPPFDPPPPSRRGEVVWLRPYPDDLLPTADAAEDPAARSTARETVEIAFIAALQVLPPRQTAALVLCDVLGFPTAETAAMLETAPTTVKGLLQRARASVAHGKTAGAHRPAGHDGEGELARRFAAAFTDNDLDGLVALLTDDAWLAMPPAPHEYHGPAAVRGFLARSAAWRGARRLHLVPTRANAQPAFGCYLEGHEPAFTGVLLLTVRSDRIAGITRFLDATLAGPFGMDTGRARPHGVP